MKRKRRKMGEEVALYVSKTERRVGRCDYSSVVDLS